MMSMLEAKSARLIATIALFVHATSTLALEDPIRTNADETKSSGNDRSRAYTPPPRIITLDEEIDRFSQMDEDLLTRFPDIRSTAAERLLKGIRTHPLARERQGPDPIDAKTSARPPKLSIHPLDTSEPRELGVRRRWKLARTTAPRTINEALFQTHYSNRIEVLCVVFANLQDSQQKARHAAESLARWDRLLALAVARAEQGTTTRHDLRQVQTEQVAAQKRLDGTRDATGPTNEVRKVRTVQFINDEHLTKVRVEHLVARERVNSTMLELERFQKLRASTFHIVLREGQQLEVGSIADIPRLPLPTLAELERLALEVRPSLLTQRITYRTLENHLGPFEQNEPAGHRPDFPPAEPLDPLANKPDGPGADADDRFDANFQGPNGLVARRIRNPVDRAKSQLESARATLDAYEQQVHSEVSAAYHDCAGKLTKLQQVEVAAVSARRSLEQAEGGHDPAKIDIARLVEAHRNDDTQQVRYLEALLEYRVSCLKLNAAVGQRIFP
jgi:hypothetical protein